MDSIVLIAAGECIVPGSRFGLRFSGLPRSIMPANSFPTLTRNAPPAGTRRCRVSALPIGLKDPMRARTSHGGRMHRLQMTEGIAS